MNSWTVTYAAFHRLRSLLGIRKCKASVPQIKPRLHHRARVRLHRYRLPLSIGAKGFEPLTPASPKHDLNAFQHDLITVT